MQHRNRSSSTDAPFLETIASLLSDRRRRSVVAALSERTAPVPLQELAATVAARDTETEADDAPAESKEIVGMDLHHVHLPKLAEHDIVDYDREANLVTSVRTDELASVSGLLNDDE